VNWNAIVRTESCGAEGGEEGSSPAPPREPAKSSVRRRMLCGGVRANEGRGMVGFGA